MRLTVLSVSYSLAKVSESTAGGAEQVLLTLDRALVEHGQRSLVLAPLGSRCCGLLAPVHTPAGGLDDRAKRQARQSFKYSLERVLDRYPVDIVHMHGVDFHQYLPESNMPVVVSLHLPLAWYPQEALRQRSNLALVAVSKTQALSSPPGACIEHTIANGVDLKRFPGRARKGDYALFLGRICPEKGVHLALEAAERANVRVILAGTVFPYPEHQKYFCDVIRPRLGEKVHLIGAVGGARKAQLLGGAKCLLVPSLAEETSCLAAMEAFAARTPVIAWPSGALPEIVSHGRTGFLVSSVEEMAEGIAGVHAISGDRCRSEAERRFSSKAMISAYMSLYRRLVAARAPSLRAA